MATDNAPSPEPTSAGGYPMERSWLVQRLQKPISLPPDHALARLDNVFSFGGGLVNGGLSSGAMDLLRDVFRFDYMGAAEFEWGAVPKALSRLAEHADDLVASSQIIPLSEVAADWRERDKPAPDGNGTVYTLCHKDHLPAVEARIRTWAREGYRADLKEPTHLSNALRPVNNWDYDRCGWLELDNGFFFFTDREMWEKTCRLFAVKTPEVAA